MALFGLLNEDIFLVFSRANRRFYARVVVELYERFFSDALIFPGRHDVIGAIYDALKLNPHLWTEEDQDFSDVAEIRVRGRRFKRDLAGPDHRQDLLLDRAYRVYGQLIDKGWLEEEAYGIRITVDMPPGAMLLAERLAALEKGLATTARGVVITIRNAVASAQVEPRTSALGLNKAAELAVRFSRELRTVLSSLRTIERDAMAAENLNQRLATYFQDFIGRLVLKDFESIYKTNHPYRFKREILDGVEVIADEGHKRDQVLEGYVDGEAAANHTEAGSLLDADLSRIRGVFDNIDETYDRINVFRVRLETRLRNTVNYAELGDHLHSRRLSQLIVRLDQAMADIAETNPRWLRQRQPEGMLLTPPVPWAPHLLAEPRSVRRSVAPGLLRRPEQDPVLSEWRQILRAYNDLFIDDLRRVRRFLDARIPPGSIREARDLPIDSVEDFLAFEHLRRLQRRPSALAEQYDFTPCPVDARRDDDWISCRNFLIRRKTSAVTLASEHS